MFAKIALVMAAQQSTVSLELPQMRMYNAAPILEKTFGVRINVATPLQNDLLCLSFSNVSRAEAMKKIAEAMNANWQQKDGYVQLEQSPEQKNAERILAETASLNRATAALTKSRAEVEKFGAFTTLDAVSLKRELEKLSQMTINESDDDSYDEGFWRLQNRVDAKGPMSRFLKRIAARVTPKMLALTTRERPRLVFALNPNGMQLAFPFEVNSIIGQFQDEQNTWADVAKGQEFQGPESKGGGRYGLGGSAQNTKPIDMNGSKILMTIHRDFDNNFFSGNVHVYDRSGRELGQEGLDLAGFDMDAYYADQEAKKTAEKPKPLVFTGFAKDVEEFRNNRGRPKVERKVLPSVRERLLKPEESELNAEYVLQLVKQVSPQPNFVLHNLVDVSREWIENGKTSAYYYNSMLRRSESDGWLVIAPGEPQTARATLLKPKELGPLVRLAASKDCSTIEEQAEIALRLPKDGSQQWRIREMLNQVRPYNLPVHNDNDALRVYATLMPPVREKLKKKLPFTLADLTQKTYEELHHSLFNAQWNWFQMDYEMVYGETGQKKFDAEELQHKVYGIWREPTEACPAGLTSNMVVKGLDSTSKRLIADPDATAKYGSPMVVDIKSLGASAFRKKFPKKYPWENNSWQRYDESSFRIVSSRVVRFSLSVRPGVLKEFHLSEIHVLDPKAYSLQTLPDEFKKQYEQGYKEAQDQDKHYPENGYYPGGISAPPPPL